MTTENQDFFINGADLDEEIDVVNFIKTLKKVDSTQNSSQDLKSTRDSGSSSSSSEKVNICTTEEKSKKLMDKRSNTTSELLASMRRRFQHRATEPIFHSLGSLDKGLSNSVPTSGSDNALKLPQVNTEDKKGADLEQTTDNRVGSAKKYLSKD